MNILLLGSGGRESAFALKFSQSGLCQNLYTAPGNPGTAQYGTNVSLKLGDFEGIGKFAAENSIDMVVVGPEEPLVKGIHDFFLADEKLKNIPVIGPQKEGAQLEGSKHFSKMFMQRHNIPTASSQSFTKETLENGLRYLQTHALPVVLKADGLAAGKGVVIAETLDEAQTELSAMLADAKFGEASATVVIEQFLSGIELSVFVLTDGKDYVLLPEAKDYKRIGEADTGLNTGGMGSVSPVPFAGADFMDKITERIIKPTISGLQQENIPYRGFIFFGLIKVGDEPYVIEYNCRMGDPETESVFVRIESDLVELLHASATGKLADYRIKVSPRTAATIVCVSAGYPGEYLKGKPITGFENVRDSVVFHAGTEQVGEEIHNSGGRVLAVTSLQENLFDALQQATADAARIYYDGVYFRKDIGFDL